MRHDGIRRTSGGLVNLVLFDPANDCLPCVFHALWRAGKNGLVGSRIPPEWLAIHANSLDAPQARGWAAFAALPIEILDLPPLVAVRLISPLRIKRDGLSSAIGVRLWHLRRRFAVSGFASHLLLRRSAFRAGVCRSAAAGRRRRGARPKTAVVRSEALLVVPTRDAAWNHRCRGASLMRAGVGQRRRNALRTSAAVGAVAILPPLRTANGPLRGCSPSQTEFRCLRLLARRFATKDGGCCPLQSAAA